MSIQINPTIQLKTETYFQKGMFNKLSIHASTEEDNVVNVNLNNSSCLLYVFYINYNTFYIGWEYNVVNVEKGGLNKD